MKANLKQTGCTDCAFDRPRDIPEGTVWLCASCVDCSVPDAHGRRNPCMYAEVFGAPDPMDAVYNELGYVYTLCSKHLAAATANVA